MEVRSPVPVEESWSTALAGALEVLRAPIGQVLLRLSEVLSPFLRHDGLVLYTGDCVLASPLLTHGIEGVTAEEIGWLAGVVGVARPWFGEASLAGVRRPVLAAAVQPPESVGGLVAITMSDGTPPPPAVRQIAQQLVELTTLHLADRLADAEPVPVGASTVTVAELSDAHAATLTSLLGVLRARRFDDATARRTAIELAVPALIETREGGEREFGEETAGDAFAMLADKLSLLTRYHDIELELAAPYDRERPLPGDAARTARAVGRGTVLALLQQGRPGRIRVAWRIEDSRLIVTTRDDGPGTLAADALPVYRLRDRVAAVGGTLTVDSVPNWGTTVTASLPLTSAPDRPVSRLDTLNPREHDVLEELSHGHRNRLIAEHLSISENTVKFHVANILSKLGVSSRGEAAALARTPNDPAAR
ncbi:LuxR C-terminal-related transcriptional regulator [Nonomuraea sp. NPDC050404]|uniref:helix-turn-helix transcriptional regulator n=1 Tax=Nonomuraea sp. NPDC050404 TaxID=3155783 RepID=UPI0033D65E76